MNAAASRSTLWHVCSRGDSRLAIDLFFSPVNIQLMATNEKASPIASEYIFAASLNCPDDNNTFALLMRGRRPGGYSPPSAAAMKQDFLEKTRSSNSEGNARMRIPVRY